MSTEPIRWPQEILASLVVFLVALPLCMGIAVACGVPPTLGLVTGIIGGILVGSIAGSPLQVSGPAAGLVVIVWDIIATYGLASLGVIVLAAGVIQILAGVAGLGRWFRAVSPAVIRGMLAGIGVLIFASQFHVMLDDTPHAEGLENLLTIPAAIWHGPLEMDGSVHQWAAITGVVTISAIVGWNLFRPRALHMVPGPLVGVLAGSIVANVLGFDILFVEVPDNLLAGLNVPEAGAFSLLAKPAVWGAALGLAAVASAESLLCATAVDQLHTGPRTNYRRELIAQGVGNVACGAVGSLPMTGVIVRSSANVEAGARTRWSAILHGIWLLLLVVLAPGLLGLIPKSALAAVLVYIGFKLVRPQTVRDLAKYGAGEAAIFVATVVAIVATDLLIGVGVGIALAVARLVFKLSYLFVDKEVKDGVLHVRVEGKASFLTLPKLAHELEAIDPRDPVHLDLSGVHYLDHAVVDLVEGWEKLRRKAGTETTVVFGDRETGLSHDTARAASS